MEFVKTLNISPRDFSCDVCMNDYGVTENVPFSLACGHTICSKCLQKVSNCPTCRAPIRDKSCYSKNVILCSLLELQTKTNLCKIHNKPLEMFCKLHEQRICLDCGFKDGHFSHIDEVIQLSEVEQIAEKTKSVWERIDKKKEESKQKLDAYSQENKNTLKRALNEALDETLEPLLTLKKKLHIEADLAVFSQNGKYGSINDEDKQEEFKKWKEDNVFLVNEWKQLPDGELISRLINNKLEIVEKEFDKIEEETLLIENTIEEKSNNFLLEMPSKLDLPKLKEISKDLWNVANDVKVENNPKLHLKRFASYLIECGIQIDDLNKVNEDSILKLRDEQGFMAREHEDQDFYCVLEKLEVKCNHLPPQNFNLFCKALQRIVGLKIFTIESCSCDEKLLFLSESIKKISSIEQFTGKFSLGPNSDEKILAIFWTDLTRLSNLKKVSIKISNLDENGDLKPLYKDLEPYKLSTLEEVELSFISFENVSQRGVGLILKSLQTGINIKKFSIIFSNCINIDQETFEELGKLFRALKNLEKLTVAFANFTDMRNINAGEAIASLAKSFLSSEKLQKFEISFAYSHDSIMEYSFSVFENFCSSPLARQLKELTIGLRKCLIVNDNYLKTLGKEISKLSQLEKLILDLRYCPASEIGISFLRNQLKKLKNSNPIVSYRQ